MTFNKIQYTRQVNYSDSTGSYAGSSTTSVKHLASYNGKIAQTYKQSAIWTTVLLAISLRRHSLASSEEVAQMDRILGHETAQLVRAYIKAYKAHQWNEAGPKAAREEMYATWVPTEEKCQAVYDLIIRSNICYVQNYLYTNEGIRLLVQFVNVTKDDKFIGAVTKEKLASITQIQNSSNSWLIAVSENAMYSLQHINDT